MPYDNLCHHILYQHVSIQNFHLTYATYTTMFAFLFICLSTLMLYADTILKKKKNLQFWKLKLVGNRGLLIPLRSSSRAYYCGTRVGCEVGSDLIELWGCESKRGRGHNELSMESSSWGQTAKRFLSMLHSTLIQLTSSVKRYFICLFCISSCSAYAPACLCASLVCLKMVGV